MSKFIPVVATIVTVVIAAVQIWTNIKIKFALDKATLIREMKTTFLRVLSWVSNLACAAVIIWFFASDRPIDRLFLFAVVGNSSALLFTAVVYQVRKIYEHMGDLAKTDSRIVEIIETLSKTDSLILEHGQLVAKLKSP